ncbi:MAG TPA: S-adenosylmethionine:tRNA ribosyltransferase-isomerase, partial [Verrucomicrobiae bacterium]|nr:S-adenosylmethionine:tRNA ribosyltransferase-isomerase [Verrucomicrobiae bacterium]
MTFDLSQYDYDLPKELIAVDPIEPRDSSRLLVYDTAKDKVSFDVFRNLEKYLQEQSLIVFNNTKVLPARTLLYKATGGKVEVLFLINEPMENGSIKAMVDRKIKIGGKLSFESGESFKVINQEGKIFFLKPEFEIKHLNELLEKFGQTPIPKYLKEATLKESKLRNRYQSVFAKNPASVAA